MKKLLLIYSPIMVGIARQTIGNIRQDRQLGKLIPKSGSRFFSFFCACMRDINNNRSPAMNIIN